MVYFKTKNPNLGKFWMALHRMENVCIFYDHLEYFTAIWNILRPFGRVYIWPFDIVCGHLVYFSHFGMFAPIKIWQPCRVARFFLVLDTKTGINVPNEHRMYHNGHKISQMCLNFSK
jgi:hypothetical protein